MTNIIRSESLDHRTIDLHELVVIGVIEASDSSGVSVIVGIDAALSPPGGKMKRPAQPAQSMDRLEIDISRRINLPPWFSFGRLRHRVGHARCGRVTSSRAGV